MPEVSEIFANFALQCAHTADKDRKYNFKSKPEETCL